jgi:hypothetical protein
VAEKLPEWLLDIKNQGSYFDFSKVKEVEPKYVAWIDIMGSSSFMSISSNKSAIFIGKLHSAVLKAKKQSQYNGNLYPFVDGVYLTSVNLYEILRITKAIYRALAINFLTENRNEYRFLIRGAVAFGNVVEAENIRDCSNVFTDKYAGAYPDGILFGSSLARANHSERQAAPFGVWIDETARLFPGQDGSTLPVTFWDWWDFETRSEEIDKYGKDLEKALAKEVSNFLSWCKTRSHELIYEKTAIERHVELSAEYFPSWPE